MRLAPRHPTTAPPQPEPEPSDPDRPHGCRARPRPPRSRAAEGLPPHVQDPEVIAKLVVLFRPNPTNPDDAEPTAGEEQGS
jgi:hypothetical protein